MATFLRGRHAHHENERQGTFLAPWLERREMLREQAAIVATVVKETGRSRPRRRMADVEVLSGVPVLGKGIPRGRSELRPESVVDRLSSLLDEA